MTVTADAFDFDWLVIGSGFGGSVSALRLSEKGFRVGVLERGRRYEPADLPASAWQSDKYTWAPRLGKLGIMRTVDVPPRLLPLPKRSRRWQPGLRRGALPSQD